MFSNPHFVAKFIETARPLKKDEILAYAETWGYVVKENAPFRILIDDSIIGVIESFFDGVILSFVSADPKTQSSIMGNVLGKLQGGCDISFLSERIEYLIQNNKIKVVEEKVDENDCYWSRTLSLMYSTAF